MQSGGPQLEVFGCKPSSSDYFNRLAIVKGKSSHVLQNEFRN
jgi:hypothetical protein